MLTITSTQNNKLSIKCHYFYKDRIKKIYSASFNPNTKQWEIDKRYLNQLEQEFQGELVYKTPRWVITGEPIPDMSRMYEITNKNIQTPSLKLKPFDYQDYGIRFMIDKILQNGFVLNADSVGLGKSIQAIGVMLWFIQTKKISKILIICKKSIKRQWLNEIKKFTDLDKDWMIDYTLETPTKRKKLYEKFQSSDKGILITNYHNFLNDTDIISQSQIDFVCIDEVHLLKCRTGVLNTNVGKIVKDKPTIFLTGTPIMSRPEDIFGIIQMVDKKYFGKWKDFSEQFLVKDYGRFGWQIVGAKHLDVLRKKIQNIVIRRTEFEVSIQLPKTIINQIDCLMDITQEKILQEIQKKQVEIISTIDTFKVNGVIPNYNKEKVEQLNKSSKALIAARQAASTDPRLFLLSNSYIMRTTFGTFLPKNYKMSSKIEAVLDLVEDIVTNQDKVILFTKFRTCATLVAHDIESNLKESVLLYTGAEDGEQRDKTIDLFKNTDIYNILIGTEAMAEG